MLENDFKSVSLHPEFISNYRVFAYSLEIIMGFHPGADGNDTTSGSRSDDKIDALLRFQIELKGSSLEELAALTLNDWLLY